MLGYCSDYSPNCEHLLVIRAYGKQKGKKKAMFSEKELVTGASKARPSSKTANSPHPKPSGPHWKRRKHLLMVRTKRVLIQQAKIVMHLRSFLTRR
jgi:hypothetical protein